MAPRPGFAVMKHLPGSDSEQIDVVNAKFRGSNIETRNNRTDDRNRSDREHYEELTPLFISDRPPKRIRWARILIANLTGNIRGVHHGVSEKHLHRYIAEFLFRFNRRARSDYLLNKALTACVSTATVTYADLNV